jgi:cleavage stimulation factor subunit 3
MNEDAIPLDDAVPDQVEPVVMEDPPEPEPVATAPVPAVPEAAPPSEALPVPAAAPSPAKKSPLFIPSAQSRPPAKKPEPVPRGVPVQGLTKEQLRQRVDEDAEDGEAWLALIADAEQKGDLEHTREVYESFLAVFPDNARSGIRSRSSLTRTQAKQWVQYADLELRHSLFPKVEALFARCLRTSTSVDLWTFYMTYIRRVNRTEGVDAEKLKQSRNVISKAYEFSLLHIGNDREAGLLWSDYIAFIRAAEVRDRAI